jgi:hypothetical protein
MRKAAVTVRLPGERMTPGKSVSTFANVGALKATANTEITCIISADGVGMGASCGRCGFVTSTLPQVPYATLSNSKIAKVQDVFESSRVEAENFLKKDACNRKPSDHFHVTSKNMLYTTCIETHG